MKMKWLHDASGLMVCILSLLAAVCMVKGEYIVLVRIHNYTNPGSLLANGSCCDLNNDGRMCAIPGCDTFFHYCLRRDGLALRCKVSSTNTDDGPVDFSASNVLGLTNPLPLPGLTQVWIPNTVEIVITANDYDGPRNSVLIKRVLHTIDVPVGRESDPITFGDSDPQKFSVIFSFKVVCAEDYYGQDCTRFCNESCTCDPGFTGEFCQEIDNCVGVDCSNSGQCLDGEDIFTCICTPGWTGAICEINIDECAAMSVTCNRRGQCVDFINDFNCDCNPGYTGKDCEVDIDDCLGVGRSSPCNGNGRCIDGVNFFICECDPDFTGRTCEVDMRMMNVGDCAAVNCSSHSQCSVNYTGCICFPDYRYTGEHCEVNICGTGLMGPSCNQSVNTDAQTMIPDEPQDQMQWALIGGVCGGLLAIGLILLLVAILFILMCTGCLKKSTTHVPLDSAEVEITHGSTSDPITDHLQENDTVPVLMKRNVCYATPQEVLSTTTNISYGRLPQRSARGHTDTQVYATIT